MIHDHPSGWMNTKIHRVDQSRILTPFQQGKYQMGLKCWSSCNFLFWRTLAAAKESHIWKTQLLSISTHGAVSLWKPQALLGGFFRLNSIYLYEPADLFLFVVFFHVVQGVRSWPSHLFSWKIWKAHTTIFSCIVIAKLISCSLEETLKMQKSIQIFSVLSCLKFSVIKLIFK